MKKNDDMYNNFEIFLTRATAEMQTKNTLTFNWLQGIRSSYGASIIALALFQGVARTSFLENQSFTSSTQKEMIEKLIRQFKNRKSTIQDKNDRLKKIEHLFYEYNSFLSGNEKKVKIDELFDDVVNDREILF